MKFLLAPALLSALLLAGCSGGIPPEMMGGKAVNRMPKYTKPVEVERFGEWFIEPGACEIQSVNGDFRVTTDGTLEDGLISLKVRFVPQLVRPPVPTLSGLPVPVPMDGSGKSYTVYLAYDSTGVAYMLRDTTYFTLRYQPLTGDTLEGNMATRPLMQAIAFVARRCG
jgi:hypothetical protein